MSLQGTFDTLSLTELLRLLAQSGKTGALLVEAGSLEGRVFLREGRCCAAETSEERGAVDTAAELSGRLVDVCFALARQESGAFRFDADQSAPFPASHEVDVVEALEVVGPLLDEWQEIRHIIPSLDLCPRLTDELGGESLLVDREIWSVLAALDGQRTIRDVARRSGRKVLAVCHTLKGLVEAGAVELGPEPPPAARPESTRPLVEPVAPYGPGVEAAAEAATEAATQVAEAAAGGPDPAEAFETLDPAEAFELLREPAAAGLPGPAGLADEDQGDGEAEEGRDRGSLLRLFSSLRES